MPNVSNSLAAEFCDFGLRGCENQIYLARASHPQNPNEGRKDRELREEARVNMPPTKNFKTGSWWLAGEGGRADLNSLIAREGGRETLQEKLQ